MSKTVTRNTVNEQQYAAPAPSKSGFQLSHRQYMSYILGRIHVSGYQDCMPADKMSGKNDGNFTFNNIVTPFVAPVDCQQYNFFIPWRPLDRTFERAFAPNKNNNMSQAWSAPTVSTKQLGQKICQLLMPATLTDAQTNAWNAIRATLRTRTSKTVAFRSIDGAPAAMYSLLSYIDDQLQVTDDPTPIVKLAKQLYIDDVLSDVLQYFRALTGYGVNQQGNKTFSLIASTTISIHDVLYIFYDAVFTPWIGRYSYYYDFGYSFLRPADYDTLASTLPLLDVAPFDNYQKLADHFNDTPQSEYYLRAIYVIWYEYFRNTDLEPVTDNLPYWRDFGSTPVVPDNICMLLYRPRPWYEDMFVSAQIDDLSRHVYAPIIGNSFDAVSYHTQDMNNLDTQSPNVSDPTYPEGMRKPAIVTLGWHDQLTGENRSIQCPIPSNINDVLAENDVDFREVYGLDLNSLRQAQQMERYLKRNYLFGDEYQDRMLAHYNSRVSDMRINRPELISQSFNSGNMSQEIASQNNGVSNAGDRVATMTLTSGGDQYSFFAEEFGVLVNVITFMPQAAYDGLHPQVLATKVAHYPLPEFATNNEEFGRKIEIADSGLLYKKPNGTPVGNNMFGRYPAYHAWRSRVDRVGGMFLNEMQDCTFRRFWGLDPDNSDKTTPALNYYFLHCRPNLGMFRDTVVYNTQLYGDVLHECFVERVLPTPVETI